MFRETVGVRTVKCSWGKEKAASESSIPPQITTYPTPGFPTGYMPYPYMSTFL